MAIFNSYVSLPEGKIEPTQKWNLSKTWFKEKISFPVQT